MNPVVHFEMPYENKNRMAGFYTKAFGWKPQMLGPEMGEYVVVATAEADEKGRPKQPGRSMVVSSRNPRIRLGSIRR